MIETTVDDIRAAIWAEIIARGEPNHRVAKRAGISHVTLNRFMRNEGGMTIHSLVNVLAALGLEMTVKKKGDDSQ